MYQQEYYNQVISPNHFKAVKSLQNDSALTTWKKKIDTFKIQ